MGLTRCYKTEGFLQLYLQFFVHILRFSIRYTRLVRRKSISIPNFDEISQSTVEIKLLPVSDDGRPTYWNVTSSYDFFMCNHPHVILHPPAGMYFEKFSTKLQAKVLLSNATHHTTKYFFFVASSPLKTCTDGAYVTRCSNAFQTRAALTRHADSRVWPTISDIDKAERRWRPASKSAGWQGSSTRYDGACPCRQLQARWVRLKTTRFAAFNQCSWRGSGVTWSYRDDENTNRAAKFITDWSRCHSNALFCCDRYSWSLDDLLRGSIHLSNFAFAISRHKLVNDNMIQTESFLYEMLCIRKGVFEFCQESDFLSRSQVDDIISFLSCEWLYVIDCTMHSTLT